MDKREAPEFVWLWPYKADPEAICDWRVGYDVDESAATPEFWRSVGCRKYIRADLTIRIPEPGSAEWAAMVERSAQANFVLCELMQSAPRRWRDLDTAGRTVFMAIADAALRAALGLDQPHRENDERHEESER